MARICGTRLGAFCAETVSSDTSFHSGNATPPFLCALEAIFGLPPPSRPPPMPSLAASPLTLTWAAPGRQKNAGVQCGRIAGCSWVLTGISDPPKCPILGLPMASGEFFLRPSFYVKVGVLVVNHKLHVTVCHRDFLWLNPFGLKFCFDVGY